MKIILATLLLFFIFGCSSMGKKEKKARTYKDLKPTTEFTFTPNEQVYQNNDPAASCMPESIAIYEKFLKNDVEQRKHKLMFLIQATKLVEINLENYVDHALKKYDDDLFEMKDQLIYNQIREILTFVAQTDEFTRKFHYYSKIMQTSCNVSYCKKDLNNLNNVKRTLNQAIDSQEKLLGLKMELMNGLYNYKIEKKLTLDQLEQLKTSIESALEKTKLQEKSVEQNDAALSLFNDKFDNLCVN